MRSEAEKAKCAAWFRDYYARVVRKRDGILKGAHCGRYGYLTLDEVRATKIAQTLQANIDAVDKKRCRKLICRKCGNHRAFIPDIGRKCGVCRVRMQERRHAKYREKAKADGRWGTMKRLAKQRRRALKRANGGTGTVTVADWQWVLDKYGTACLSCGHHCDGRPTVDHVVPLTLGGPHDKTNLQPLCLMCNSYKGSLIIDYRPDRPLAPIAKDPKVIKYV